MSEFLPNLNELRDVPTRPLNSFESDALDELRRNQDVVIDFQPTEIRMIGAIRSAAQCIECHPVERGTLLGAFSYHLGPVLDTKDLK